MHEKQDSLATLLIYNAHSTAIGRNAGSSRLHGKTRSVSALIQTHVQQFNQAIKSSFCSRSRSMFFVHALVDMKWIWDTATEFMRRSCNVATSEISP
ncbi:hypothetical protein BaRGS_00018766 [Batillaria attramentaria]|uniref:Uncharacterized protein n=1 Tax=Batillaria attramentaria TaxID=370345 RepID=A0ABD0KSM5_9CAEN